MEDVWILGVMVLLVGLVGYQAHVIATLAKPHEPPRRTPRQPQPQPPRRSAEWQQEFGTQLMQKRARENRRVTETNQRNRTATEILQDRPMNISMPATEAIARAGRGISPREQGAEVDSDG